MAAVSDGGDSTKTDASRDCMEEANALHKEEVNTPVVCCDGNREWVASKVRARGAAADRMVLSLSEAMSGPCMGVALQTLSSEVTGQFLIRFLVTMEENLVSPGQPISLW